MLDIELLDYTGDDSITVETRNEIIRIVHDVLEQTNRKRPTHTRFKFHRAGKLDVSCFDEGDFAELNTRAYDYILVVDYERITRYSLSLKRDVREGIGSLVAGLLHIPKERITVEYRVSDSAQR